MSPNNPTCKDSLQVHAARLREMIDDLACFGLDADGAAALLAGAEALLAVEAAKANETALERCVAAFVEFWKAGLGWDSPAKTAYLTARAQLDERIKTAALARLEGK